MTVNKPVFIYAILGILKYCNVYVSTIALYKTFLQLYCDGSYLNLIEGEFRIDI